MATAFSSVKWRLQANRVSVVDQEVYYIEFTSEQVTLQQLKDLKKQLELLGYVNVSYGLLVVVP